MSVINQMLRDLDARRGPAGQSQLNALHGIGPVALRPALASRGLQRAGWALAAGLLFAGFVYWPVALQQDSGPAQAPVARVAEWTSLSVPEPDPRARSSSRRQAAVPAARAPRPSVEVEPASKAQQQPGSAQPTPTAEPPTTAALTTEIDQAAQPPVVESAALEPARAEPLRTVRNHSPELNAQQRFARAQRALASQDWRMAQGLLEQTLDSAPGHIDARTQLATLLVSRGAADQAERILADGLALDPHAEALAKPYAQLLAARGALQPALDVLDAVRSDAETHALRAAILHRAGDHAGASAAYQRALREQPERAVWWTGLAIAREHNQEHGEALQAYRRAAGLQLDEPVRDYVEQRIQALQTGKGG